MENLKSRFRARSQSVNDKPRVLLRLRHTANGRHSSLLHSPNLTRATLDDFYRQRAQRYVLWLTIFSLIKRCTCK